MPTTYWNFAFTLYLIALTYWIGGGLYLATAGHRAVRLLEPAQRQNTYLHLLSIYVNTLTWVVPLCLVSSSIDFIHKLESRHLSIYSYADEALTWLMAIIFIGLYGTSFQKLRRALRPQNTLFHRVRLLIASMAMIGLAVLALITLHMTP